ncbi:MAG: hypothetical protein IKK02_07300 [Tidjanibacter sp.]|nr:hypothetical protein [Tidjanibacter sp.]
MDKAIGGYNQLELRSGGHYHKDALRLNTARNCLEYILRVRNYKKVYVPYYTCEVILEPFNKLDVAYEFYHINEELNIKDDINLTEGEAILYTNYYGLKQSSVEQLAKKYGPRLIVDNAQAFFAPRINGIDTFYSARKFFGVPDGAYLYIDEELTEELEQDVSYDRMQHLLKRIDLSAEAGYDDFQQVEHELCNQPIKRMSKLTEAILCSINYKKCAQIRRNNYLEFDKSLSDCNGIHLDVDSNAVPLAYPYLADDVDLRNCLISRRIYVPTYWPNVEDWAGNDAPETLMANNILPLPIDQRCGVEDMNRIINIISNGTNSFV